MREITRVINETWGPYVSAIHCQLTTSKVVEVGYPGGDLAITRREGCWLITGYCLTRSLVHFTTTTRGELMAALDELIAPPIGDAPLSVMAAALALNDVRGLSSRVVVTRDDYNFAEILINGTRISITEEDGWIVIKTRPAGEYHDPATSTVLSVQSTAILAASEAIRDAITKSEETHA